VIASVTVRCIRHAELQLSWEDSPSVWLPSLSSLPSAAEPAGTRIWDRERALAPGRQRRAARKCSATRAVQARAVVFFANESISGEPNAPRRDFPTGLHAVPRASTSEQDRIMTDALWVTVLLAVLLVCVGVGLLSRG
jgi:hypothetical protein